MQCTLSQLNISHYSLYFFYINKISNVTHIIANFKNSNILHLGNIMYSVLVTFNVVVNP